MTNIFFQKVDAFEIYLQEYFDLTEAYPNPTPDNIGFLFEKAADLAESIPRISPEERTKETIRAQITLNIKIYLAFCRYLSQHKDIFPKLGYTFLTVLRGQSRMLAKCGVCPDFADFYENHLQKAFSDCASSSGL